jgi:ATP-dependent helicase HrpA
LQEALRARSGEPLLQACAAELQRLSGLEISAGDLDEDTIPNHLRFLLRVTDADGKTLRSGRDLAELQAELGERAQRRFMDRQGADFNRDGATDWDFGELPVEVTTADGARAWPALVDQGEAVGLRLFDTWEEAVFAHESGVTRLLALRMADKARYLQTHHGLERASLLAWSTVGSAAELVADLFLRSLVDTAAAVVSAGLHEVRGAEAFAALAGQVRSRIGRTFLARAGELNESLALYGKVALVIKGPVRKQWPEAFQDLDSQLQDLVYPGFLAELEGGRLHHYPRYLQAIEERLAQLELNPLRDRQRQAEIDPWWQRYCDALAAGSDYDEAMDAFRWLLHEYRVSLFAQRLGTAAKVSAKRLSDAWRATGC